MAAAALEQSMLESKDKDTLLEMAKALGVKVSSRQKKSDIIDKILDTTGPSAPTADAIAGNGQPVDEATLDDRPGAGRPRRRVTLSRRDAPQSKGASDAAAVAEPAEVVLGPDGEPLADWEIELAKGGDTASRRAEVGRGPGVGRRRNEMAASARPLGRRPGWTGPRRDQQRERQRSDHKSGDHKSGDQGSQGRNDQQRNDRGQGARAASRTATSKAAVKVAVSATTTAATSRVRATSVAVVAARVAAARRVRRAKTSSYSSRTPASRAVSRSMSRATSTSATRATASCASTATSRPSRTRTFR